MRQRAARGEPTPALDTWPSPRPSLLPVLHAFWALSAARPVGFQPGAIPLTEIVALLDLRGITGASDRADWVRLIRALDMEWLSFQAEKAKKR